MNIREYADRPAIGAGAVIVEDDRVALVKRAHPPFEGEWSIPGGLVELGENLRQAAEREALEETGLVVEAGYLLELFENINTDSQDKTKYHYVVADFICRVKSGELCAGADAAEARWVRAEELAGLHVTESAARVVRKALGLGGKK